MNLLELESLYKFEPMLIDYYKLLSPEIPKFILEYSNTKEMLKQQYISVSCGTYYSKLYNIDWFSSLEHSIWVALIIRNFTKDKKQTLSWLFHDIATPVFKHSIDYMNWDYHTQESTEELTTKTIKNSKEIMKLLDRDWIKLEEINDYHIYPIADNNSPKLSADRLEYSLSNALFTYKTKDFSNIEKIYNNIEIQKNENNEIELWFINKKIAELFEEMMWELSIIYMIDKTRFSMQLLADILKIMNENNEINIEDLYSLKEEDIINKIRNSKIWNIKECFEIRENSEKINISNKEPINKYFVHHWTKIRYIDPLTRYNNEYKRISELSLNVKNIISKCLNFKMDNYMYLDFNINTH